MTNLNYNNLTLNRWNDFSFNINGQMITDNVINNSLSSLKTYLFSSNLLNENEPKNVKLLILFKVKSINSQYRTISYMQTININDFDQLNKLFIEYWNLRDEDYYIAPNIWKGVHLLIDVILKHQYHK